VTVIFYLDSSTVVRTLFGEDHRLDGWSDWTRAYSSRLLSVEVRRTISRLRLLGALTDSGIATALTELTRIESTVNLLPLTAPVLRSAGGPMPTAVKTLDALHLATAMLIRERLEPELVFATHDRQQGLAAQALGFTVAGV